VITTFHAKNYGCLVDVTAHVTPLHAFIGPNDSGKSTLLHGMRTVVQLASGKFGTGPDGQSGTEPHGWAIPPMAARPPVH